MTVLTRTECEKVNEIVDYILIHTNISVADVKEKFGLSKEEYEMISELMMPPLRWYNSAKYGAGPANRRATEEGAGGK